MVVIGVNKRADKVRVDRLYHDIYILDTLVYLKEKSNLSLNMVTSEKELHALDGFGNRHHHPDYIITAGDIRHAVEIETSLKAKDRLEKNIESNYLNYDKQMWFVNANETKLCRLLKEAQERYSNIMVYDLKDVTAFVVGK